MSHADSPERQVQQPAGSTSRSLIQRIRDNECDAWGRLVGLYAPLVVYWCRRMDLPDQDISDMLQEVFQAVSMSIASFRKQRAGDTFRGWLRTITKNKVYDLYRRRTREPQATGGTEANLRFTQMPARSAEASSVDDSAADPLDVHSALYFRALDLICREFEERTWQAFWRVVVDGRAPKDVGLELDMKPGTVRVAKCRVLQRLRLELGDTPGDGPAERL